MIYDDICSPILFPTLRKRLYAIFRHQSAFYLRRLEERHPVSLSARHPGCVASLSTSEQSLTKLSGFFSSILLFQLINIINGMIFKVSLNEINKIFLKIKKSWF